MGRVSVRYLLLMMMSRTRREFSLRLEIVLAWLYCDSSFAHVFLCTNNVVNGTESFDFICNRVVMKLNLLMNKLT